MKSFEYNLLLHAPRGAWGGSAGSRLLSLWTWNTQQEEKDTLDAKKTRVLKRRLNLALCSLHVHRTCFLGHIPGRDLLALSPIQVGNDDTGNCAHEHSKRICSRKAVASKFLTRVLKKHGTLGEHKGHRCLLEGR